MALEIVYKYRLVNTTMIAGWAQLPLIDRPDLRLVPHPTEEMKRALKDQYKNYKFSLVDNKIIDNIIEPTEHQESLEELSATQLFKIIKALIQGIENGGQGAAYDRLKSVVNKIQNGF